jgi:Flp pilus assembly pilin Flp
LVFDRWLRRLVELFRHDRGQTLVEYSLIIAMVSIGSIAVLLALSGKLNDVFNTIAGVI